MNSIFLFELMVFSLLKLKKNIFLLELEDFFWVDNRGELISFNELLFEKLLFELFLFFDYKCNNFL